MKSGINDLSVAFEISKEGTTKGWVRILHDSWNKEQMSNKIMKYLGLGYIIRKS